jgi:L-ascorbate metabolism protein UlaG (beta-lactamase superfamily)
MRITWLGHATVLLELDGTRLLTDPLLGNRLGPLVRIAGPVAPAALGRIDGVLLSHLHADHTDLSSLRSIGLGVPVLAPRPAARWLESNGFEDVTELSAGEKAVVAGLPVRATPATHDARRRPLLGPRADPIGYLVGSVYFAGDTDLFGAMQDLSGATDLALLPVWGWGRSLGPGHLDPRRAARAVATISPRVAVPIHWGTFALPGAIRGSRDPRWPAREFATLTSRYAPDVEVRILSPGEGTEL